MIYQSTQAEKNAARQVAELMLAAARTAPKARRMDNIEALIIDGEEKDALTAAMREIGQASGHKFIIRDAGNLDDCPYVVLIGVKDSPRGLNCAMCGVENCAAAARQGLRCAMAVTDLGIAIGSAVTVAMNHCVDNRVLFSAGQGALKLWFFSEKVKVGYGIGLSVAGKNVFFDRPPV